MDGDGGWRMVVEFLIIYKNLKNDMVYTLCIDAYIWVGKMYKTIYLG